MSAAQHNKIKQRRTPTWLQRLSAQDRKAVDAIIQWIKPVPWQWFITLTFPWNVRWQTAVKKLRQLPQRLEEHTKARVCFIAGQESRPAQLGMNVPHHFHMLLIGQGVTTKEAIEASWNRLVSWEQAGNEIKDNTSVEAYDPNAPGAAYCLKWLNEDHSDWHIYNLEHFLPSAPGPSKPNHRTIRTAKRAKLLAERIASNPSPIEPFRVLKKEPGATTERHPLIENSFPQVGEMREGRQRLLAFAGPEAVHTDS